MLVIFPIFAFKNNCILAVEPWHQIDDLHTILLPIMSEVFNTFALWPSLYPLYAFNIVGFLIHVVLITGSRTIDLGKLYALNTTTD